MQAALREAQQAVEMEPAKADNVPGLWASFRKRNQQRAEAEQSLRKAISLDPEIHAVSAGDGWFLPASEIEWTEAKPSISLPLDIATDNTIPRASLASFYPRLGEKRTSRENSAAG